MATKFSRFIDNLLGFTTLLTESKCYISVLRYVSLNDTTYFSPHALFLQARSHILHHLDLCYDSASTHFKQISQVPTYILQRSTF